MPRSARSSSMLRWGVLLVALALIATGCGLVRPGQASKGATSAPSRAVAASSPAAPPVQPSTAPSSASSANSSPSTASSSPSTASANPSAAATATGTDWASLVSKVRSGVVRLQVVGCDSAWSGSGFLVAPDLIVTAAHVARGASTISAKSDSGIVRAEVVAYNLSADTALLRTQAPITGYVFHIAKQEPSLGEDIGVLGYPLGVSSLRIDPGIISGGDTSVTYGGADGYTLNDAIVTNAATNPGNSGGPAINRQGQVVGLVSGSRAWSAGSVAPVQGTNYLVPSSTLSSKVAAWESRPTAEVNDCGNQIEAPTSENFELAVTIESRSPDASDVALALYTHGDSINQGHYLAAWAIFTPRLQAHFGNNETGWARKLQTSYWTTLDVRTVSRHGAAATAHVTLRTAQNPQFGYHHQDCSVYHMIYRMQLTGGGWLIDHADPGRGPTTC